MAKSISHYSILLSSPGDLTNERSEIPLVINELNLTYGKSNNLHFELIKWETNSAPGISSDYSQSLINEDIGDDYDIFIGILWKKFGTKTPMAESGTEEEFLRALSRFKNGENIQILFYFKQEAILMHEIQPEEITKIKELQKRLKENNILYWNFNTTEDLKNQLRIHLPKRTDGLLTSSSIEKKHATCNIQNRATYYY